MLQYYCIPSCDKCRKARKLLQEKKIDHHETNMRKDGVPNTVVDAWVEAYGADAIMNYKSTTWRGLDEGLKNELKTAPADLVNTNPAMLDRPILDFGDHILTGKKALEWLEEA